MFNVTYRFCIFIGTANFTRRIQLKHIMTAEEAALYETVDVYTNAYRPSCRNIPSGCRI